MAKQIVDWNNPEKRILAKRTRTLYPVVCTGTDCEGIRFLQKSDALKAEAKGDAGNCKVCTARAALVLAKKALIEKYGADYLIHILRAYRFENPSSWEVAVEDYLQANNIVYEREVIVIISATRKAIFDFVITNPDGKTFYLEVDGWQHFNRPEIAERDEAKNKWAKDNQNILIRIFELKFIAVAVQDGLNLVNNTLAF